MLVEFSEGTVGAVCAEANSAAIGADPSAMRKRRPCRLPSAWSRRKPSYEGLHVKRKVLVSVNSDYQTGCASCQPRIRRDPAIPNHDPCIREKEFLAAGPIFTSAP